MDAKLGSLHDRLTRIAFVLAQIRSLPESWHDVYFHFFEFNTPLRELEVAEFEAKHAEKLPDDFRAYLLTIGSGAGPNAGIAPLRDCNLTWFDCEGITRALQHGRQLAEQFPLGSSARWNALLERFDDSSTTLNRCCALRLGRAYSDGSTLLVISGPTAGTIWRDCSGGDFSDLIPTGMTFLEWLEFWVELLPRPEPASIPIELLDGTELQARNEHDYTRWWCVCGQNVKIDWPDMLDLLRSEISAHGDVFETGTGVGIDCPNCKRRYLVPGGLSGTTIIEAAPDAE